MVPWTTVAAVAVHHGSAVRSLKLDARPALVVRFSQRELLEEEGAEGDLTTTSVGGGAERWHCFVLDGKANGTWRGEAWDRKSYNGENSWWAPFIGPQREQSGWEVVTDGSVDFNGAMVSSIDSTLRGREMEGSCRERKRRWRGSSKGGGDARRGGFNRQRRWRRLDDRRKETTGIGSSWAVKAEWAGGTGGPVLELKMKLIIRN
jgi:hypothetical protein